MNREEYIKYLIAKNNFNIKSFSNHINMPYSTLRSILENGIGGASIDNVLKICNGLNISIETLKPINELKDFLTIKEKTVISAYRKRTDMQPAVDKLLGIEDPETIKIRYAARNGNSGEHELTKEEIEKFNELPDMTDI